MCLFTVCIALYFSASAQSELTYNNGVWQDGTKLNTGQVKDLMSVNSEASARRRLLKMNGVAFGVVSDQCRQLKAHIALL